MKLLKTLIVLVCFLVCIFEVFSSGGKEEKTADLVFDGHISYLEGSVYINGAEAETGDSVVKGDLIETETDSLCEIVFNIRNIIRLESDSVFRIGNTMKMDFSIEKGSIAVVADKLERIAGNSERLVIKTPTAVMGVRGTVFYIKVESEKSSYVCVCNGTVNTYKGDGKSRRKVTSRHHTASRFVKEGKSIKRKAGTLLYHDDEKMEKLAEKIDVEIDWGDEKAYE